MPSLHKPESSEQTQKQGQGQEGIIPSEFTSLKNKILNSGASAVQKFDPINDICAHLHAYHVYASDPTRCLEANHYCSQISEDVRQCVIYDSPEPNARLIGIEYMVTPRIYESLPEEERKLWHSHVYEVKSGMLIMPGPKGMPDAAWETAETAEMKKVIELYGKTYHLWQVDRGDPVPMGAPQLMGSFTSDAAVAKAKPGGVQELTKTTESKFGVDIKRKAEKRKDIGADVKIHPGRCSPNILMLCGYKWLLGA
ncbi:hypothetical protein AJ80_08394 [Polytolypa hystricis UAMH7299]|uniref:DUF1264 domain-containing protein n=1 Tax=Polytolypa hystricis (strain UAMH7299) TaxID=1447883 RepID=A0A2B7X932_POLH7|nr:hypothetical protein AJ80_08394 [Polytolypa hystricis UAMH7299]